MEPKCAFRMLLCKKLRPYISPADRQHGLSIPLRKVTPSTLPAQITLTGSLSLRTKLALILRATRTHARNLATFAFLYKALMYLLRHTPRSLSSDASILAQDKEARYDALLAGLLGGYAVFGRGSQSSVNRQIVIYVFARVVLGLADLGAQQSGAWIPDGVRQQVIHGAWPVFAAGSWGLVMWLYRWHPEVVQPSMRSSMTYM